MHMEYMKEKMIESVWTTQLEDREPAILIMEGLGQQSKMYLSESLLCQVIKQVPWEALSSGRVDAIGISLMRDLSGALQD